MIIPVKGGVHPRNGGIEKHENIASIVEKELQNRGWYTERNKEYSEPHFAGDYDVLAIKNKYRNIIEVKSNHTKENYEKAMKQLYKGSMHSQLYSPQDRVFTWYATSLPDDSSIALTKINQEHLINYKGGK